MTDAAFPIQGGEHLSFDFFAPDTGGPHPLVVFLHGGGWISGDKTMYSDEAEWLADQGYACACISYRLAPLYPFPAPVADCQSFVRFMRENASQFSIKPDQIAAMGNSAGGHLALMLGLCKESFDGGPADGSQCANAVIDVCGITDFRAPQTSHFPIAFSFLEQFIPTILDPESKETQQASPIVYASADAVPCLVLHGDEDDVVPIDQSRLLAKALGSKAKYVELEGEAHSFSYVGWNTIRREYTAFLKEVFGS